MTNVLPIVVGGLQLEPDKLRYEGNDPYKGPLHRFVLEYRKDAYALFVAMKNGHEAVAKAFCDEWQTGAFVGGGSVYIDKENRLIVGSRSKQYGAVPQPVAQECAELIASELITKAELTSGAVGQPDGSGYLYRHWRG